MLFLFRVLPCFSLPVCIRSACGHVLCWRGERTNTKLGRKGLRAAPALRAARRYARRHPPSLLQDTERATALSDAIIHTRITNDEKALRRVTRKFHTYASVAYPPIVPPTPSNGTSVEDARDAFLLELASFQLSLKKSFMVCEAEARQVEEYQHERGRIGMQLLPRRHVVLTGSCDQQTSAAA